MLVLSALLLSLSFAHAEYLLASFYFQRSLSKQRNRSMKISVRNNLGVFKCIEVVHALCRLWEIGAHLWSSINFEPIISINLHLNCLVTITFSFFFYQVQFVSLVSFFPHKNKKVFWGTYFWRCLTPQAWWQLLVSTET